MKRRRESMSRLSFLLLLWTLVLSACRGGEARPTTGSETHFLSRCADSDACGDGFECLCGVCTSACSSSGDCARAAPSATCRAVDERPPEQSCGDVLVAASCEVSCSGLADCAALGDAYRCDRGFCRQLPEDCETGRVAAREVVLLGDLFLAETGQITSALEELARDAGAIGPGEAYRDYSSTLVTPFGRGDDPATQYATAREEGAAKVVILDAGGADALVACEEPPTPMCAGIDDVATAVNELLARMALDGVEDVVLFFYPDPEDAALASKFDVLRSHLQIVCGSSSAPCRFLDLRQTFAGRDGYLQEGGLLPTQAGSIATAGELWGLMQAHCIAQ